MASFARGFSLLPCRHLAPRSVGPARFFTSSLARLKTPPVALSNVTASTNLRTVSQRYIASSQKPAAAVVAAQTSRYAFIKRLAARQTPTVLYEAPSHFWFYFGCWSSGLVMLAWTLLSGPYVIKQPEGIPQWVSVVYGTAYVFLCAMALITISKTRNIVSTIRLLPPVSAGNSTTNTAVSAAPVATAAAAAAAAGMAPLQLEITVKRMMPLLLPKTFTTSLDDVSLQSRFSLPSEYVPELKRLELREQEEQRRKELHEFDMQHGMTMAFRKLGRAFVSMFKGVRAAWTNMGFGQINVDGKTYKVDVTDGYAHDEFRTLERLVEVCPK
ncbi:hypothetical protein E4U40_002030 [Claviceps sp. LM458 group G5]|nr:hypothetical protein E4U40_002030 [Claviceps sp. LM458 group G5]